MSIAPNILTIVGVVHISDILSMIGVEDSDGFTANIGGVTWGDASYTLIRPKRFWEEFIRDNPEALEQGIEWTLDDFVTMMERHDISYINLED